jgi:nagB: glucosamine-6-phosphate isomerase
MASLFVTKPLQTNWKSVPTNISKTSKKLIC